MWRFGIEENPETRGRKLVAREESDVYRSWTLSDIELLQITSKMNFISVGQPTVIKNFHAFELNPGGQPPLGTLTQYPLAYLAPAEAIRQGKLKPVEDVIQYVAAKAAQNLIEVPAVATLVAEQGNETPIPDVIMGAISERLGTVFRAQRASRNVLTAGAAAAMETEIAFDPDAT